MRTRAAATVAARNTSSNTRGTARLRGRESESATLAWMTSSPAAARPSPQTLSMTQVLLCGALVVTLSMGIRHGFGLWLQPITMDRGWSREPFAPAIAVQNLAWGLAGPVAGLVADRFGAYRVLLVGAAEAVGYVPKGTHHWEDFVTPEELEALLSEAGLAVTARRGIAWRPGKGLHLSDDMSLNYILSARRS